MKKIFSKINNTSIVLKASIVYILANLLNKGIGIITIPIFTHILSTSEMGIVSTYTSWMAILGTIASMSLTSGSLSIALVEYKNQRDQYQSSILTLSTISSVFALIIYVLFSDKLNNIFTLSTPLMLFMFVTFIFSPAMEIWLTRQRYEYKVSKMASVSVASNVGSALVAITAVILYNKLNTGSLGSIRIYATYGTLLCFAIFFYYKIMSAGKCFVNGTYWKNGLKISLPLMIHTLAKTVLDVSDRTMISNFCGKDAVGVYGTIYSVSSLSLIVWTSINNAFVPYLYEKLETKKSRDAEDICKIVNVMLIAYAIFAVLFTAIAPEIVKLLTTEAYYEAIYIIPPIAAGIFLTSLYNIFADVLLFHKKSNMIMCATVIATVLNIVLNYIFIPQYGYTAAAYTTLIAFVVLAITQCIAMKMAHKQKLFNLKFIFSLSAIVVMLCIMFNFLYNSYLRYVIIIIIIIVLVKWRNIFINSFIKMKK